MIELCLVFFEKIKVSFFEKNAACVFLQIMLSF